MKVAHANDHIPFWMVRIVHFSYSDPVSMTVTRRIVPYEAMKYKGKKEDG